MKILYLDQTSIADCIGVFVRDARIIPAGTTVNAMSTRHKNAEYDRYAQDYDIHFIFESNRPEPDFYTVPQFDIFAVDSCGGYLGTLGGTTDTHSDCPIYYIDPSRNVFHITDNFRQLITKPEHWKERLVPSQDIRFFPSREDAEATLEFIDPGEIP